MRSNFMDSITKIHYHVTGYRYIDGKYVDGEGNELLGEQGIPLTSISFDEGKETSKIISTSITIGYNPGTRDRDIKGIREIAKRYDKSDEAKHISQKNAKRELSNM